MDREIRVLFAEDSATDCELAVRSLERDGLRVQWTRVDQEEGFRDALSRFHPELVLADFSMPSFDGLDALAIVRELRPDLPFIFLSGTIGEERAVQGLRAGATDYVLKHNPARLPAAVRRALQEAEARAEQRRSATMLREISETSRDWIWELDAERRFQSTNGAVRELLGIEPDTLAGCLQDELMHPEDVTAMRDALAGMGRDRPALRSITARWVAADGSLRWLERTIVARLDPRGRVVGYFGSDRDVTEQRVAAARIARMARVLKMQSDFSSVAIRAQRVEDLLAEACRLATGIGGYRFALVSRVESRAREARVVASAGLDADARPLGIPLVAGRGSQSVTGLAIASGEARLHACGEAPGVLEQELARDVVALAAVPLVVDGTAIGALTVGVSREGFLDHQELRLLQELANNLAFALRFHERQDAVQFLSYFDPLTGLAKRSLFCERLARAHAEGAPAEQLASVVVFDIERLHVVNDRHGRAFGDLLLQRVAGRLRSRIANPDWIAHLGGGMFALAGPGEFLVRQVAWIFQRPFVIEGSSLSLAIRMGTAPADRKSFDPEALLQNAEAALLRARQSGERVCEYTTALRSEIAERLALEYRLQNALAESQFVVHYQPVVDIRNGRVRSVEALLRWNDPQRGTVPPGEFLSVLEDSGLIVDVGYWVLETAARDCRRWQAAGLPRLRVAVNLAAAQLQRPDFVSRVMAIVTGAETSAPIDLEVTEGSIVADFEASTEKLRAVRAAGVRIAIDDFGTGYSSLSRLIGLPIDILKIDRSFISRMASVPSAMTITTTIVGLAKSLNMRIVAEGVETEEQMNLLRQLDCDEAQGYLHCRPLPLEEMLAWAESRESKDGP